MIPTYLMHSIPKKIEKFLKIVPKILGYYNKIPYLCILKLRIMLEKECTRCKIIKPYSEYTVDNNTSTGIRSACKCCTKKSKPVYISGKYKTNPEKRKASQQAYIERNRDLIRERKRLWKINKKATDPLYKMKENLRRRTAKAFKTKSWRKSLGTETLLKGTYQEVFDHIESQFTEGMTWENQGEWHIDHIIPLDSAKTQEDIIKLFNYTNLQPLWAIDNIKKGSKVEL